MLNQTHSDTSHSVLHYKCKIDLSDNKLHRQCGIEFVIPYGLVLLVCFSLQVTPYVYLHE